MSLSRRSLFATSVALAGVESLWPLSAPRASQKVGAPQKFGQTPHTRFALNAEIWYGERVLAADSWD